MLPSPLRSQPSIWSAIHPRLVELVRSHRSTLVFVNSRRTAERLAAALNDLAGEPLARAHHGSLARAQRTDVRTLQARRAATAHLRRDDWVYYAPTLLAQAQAFRQTQTALQPGSGWQASGRTS